MASKKTAKKKSCRAEKGAKTKSGQSKTSARNAFERGLDDIDTDPNTPPQFRKHRKKKTSIVDDYPKELLTSMDFSSILNKETMIMHEMREKFLASQKRFDIVPAGRRSGKTVEARTRLIWGTFHIGGNHHGCLFPPPGVEEPIFVYAAPTYSQAKKIIWEKIKKEAPAWAIAKIIETELTIYFVTGAKLMVVGMDKPERVEGIAIDGICLDEFADMKPTAWTSSVRPALSTRGRPPGWALFIGRPRGKNHFWKMFRAAQKEENRATWGVYYPWPSWVVMDADEVAAARRELDPKSFDQEYGGVFVDSGTLAYYQFGEYNQRSVEYDPTQELQFSFDFNVSPGIALVSQDYDEVIDLVYCPRCTRPSPGKSGEKCPTCGGVNPHETITAFIDEIYIKDDSNTRLVCEALIKAWAHKHRGTVVCYGDATGGARKTSSEQSDWQIIDDYLQKRWPSLELDIQKSNPLQRDRTVVTNSRLMNAAGVVRVIIDPERCPRLIEDFETTELAPNGDLDEGPEGLNTHMTDAAGYLLWRRFGSPIYSSDDGEEFTPM